MGQLFSWIRGPRDIQALQDVAVEQQSQPKKTAPIPATQVSTIKPAEFETAPISYTKATPVHPAARDVAVAASAAVAKEKQEGTKPEEKKKDMSKTTSISPTKATAVKPASGVVSTAGASSAAGAASARKGKPEEMKANKTIEEMPKSAPISPSKTVSAKAEPAKSIATAPTTGAASTAATAVAAVKGKMEELKPLEISKAGFPKAEHAKPTLAMGAADAVRPAAVAVAKGKPKATPKETKKHGNDPFDALADSLPPSKPLTPTASKYTGPEVKEHEITSEKEVLCGVKDSTLPPGYRLEDMDKKIPIEKMDSEPKVPMAPLSTDEALDTLSAGFVCSAPIMEKKEPKAENMAVTIATSAKLSTKSTAPPADKKAKVDKGASMSLEALGALGNMLDAPEPVPESPKVRPEDIVMEDKLKSEKGVRVGEREDSLPPDYRFKEDKLKDLPVPVKEPSMDSEEALDILGEDFESPTAAKVVPAVQVPVITPTPPSKQPKVEGKGATTAPARDFVVPKKASDVLAPMIPASQAPTQKALIPAAPRPAPPSSAVAKPNEGASISLDALSALGDTLGAPEPVPESPKIRPEDIVTEAKLKSEKGVRVGEREDSLPPEYRFKEDKLKDLPVPEMQEASMDSAAALDLLSGDFDSPTSIPTTKASAVTPAVPSEQPSIDFSCLEEEVAPAVATVQSAVIPTALAARQLSFGTADALDALSDTLMDTTPIPELAPVPEKDDVKENKIVEEKLVKTGERDDSLPPEFQPSEKDLPPKKDMKAKADIKPKQPSMDETTALDLLSSDFSATAAPTAPAAPTTLAAPTAAPAPPATTTPAAPTGPASAAAPLAQPVAKPNATTSPAVQTVKAAASVAMAQPSQKSKSGKSKPKPKNKREDDASAIDDVSKQLGSDVVAVSPLKKGGKS